MTAQTLPTPAIPKKSNSRKFSPWKLTVHLILTLLSLACLVPLWLIVSASLTDEVALTRNGYTLIPSVFSLEAYQYIFEYPVQIIRAYGVTTFVTIVGTVVALLVTSLVAYPLSRKDFFMRRFVAFYIFFTMLFGGGLVPYYILVTRYLHIQDSLIVLITPFLAGQYYILMLRSFFQTLPQELFDAARVDGADEFRIFFQLVLPLSKPALATIGLFLILNYWNDWTTALYFIRDRALFPLQYLLYAINQSADVIARNPELADQKVPTQTLRMAMVVLATGPASLAFLAVQKYLVKGLTLGAVKS